MNALSIPEILDHIALHLPPDELYKLGQLNSRCRLLASIDTLTSRSVFSQNNLTLFIATSKAIKPFQLGHLPLCRLGKHYLASFFCHFGFNSTTLSTLLKKNAGYMNWCQIPPFWNHVAWSDVMPDVFPPGNRELVYDSIKQLPVSFTNNLKHDPILYTYWSCYFQDAIAAKNSITALLTLKKGNPEVPYILAGAFYFAYNSGNAQVTRVVLETEKVDLNLWGPQALADASRLGHTEIVEMLLERNDIDFRAAGNRAAVAVAFNWAKENGKVQVLDVLKKAGLSN
ncbi:UNVERIFIED_CONTAM: hypothetical protein HDU68_000610 [Siphonaria sp. JEL0065]|nr:hypothetical protein HDU68_000610 [Siphonaria sp. JEL0065]